MARQRERELVSIYASAVITDTYQLLPTRDDIDLNRTGPGIEAVLDELFDDGRGPLDHFAGGNLVDQVARKLSNRHTREVGDDEGRSFFQNAREKSRRIQR